MKSKLKMKEHNGSLTYHDGLIVLCNFSFQNTLALLVVTAARESNKGRDVAINHLLERITVKSIWMDNLTRDNS